MILNPCHSYGPAATPVHIAATELLAHAELHLHHPDLAAACRRYVGATSPRARAACTTLDERMTILTTWQDWREAIAA